METRSTSETCSNISQATHNNQENKNASIPDFLTSYIDAPDSKADFYF
jgi:hypothetical protein